MSRFPMTLSLLCMATLTFSASPANAQSAAKLAKGKSITFTGRVLDRITGMPVTGAVVTVERAVTARPKENVKAYKRVTKARTNDKGEYSFALKADELAKPRLYIAVNTKHPRYAGPGRTGRSLARLRKNQRLGAAPFFAELKLYPGKEVTAVVVAPDGSPVSGVKVTAFSRHARAKRFEFNGFHETKTDKNGRFRMTVPVPGTTAYWIYPTRFAIQAHLITKQHGDLGKIVVQNGPRLKGRVLDAKGKPVAGIYIGARQTGGDGDIQSFLNENAVANLIARSATTNAKGEFELDDLPAGDYGLRVEPNRDRYAKPKKLVFLPRTLKLSATEKPKPLTIRATPHVELHARWIDSKGKPASGYGFYVFGRLDGKFWTGRTPRPDPKTGKIYLAVPHGLQQARLNLITSSAKCIRWRLKPGDKLRRGRYIPLGNLDDDRFGIEIVHFNSPTLLVKTVDEKGKTIPDVTIKSEYEPQKPPARFGVRTPTGDVRFRKQSDGRWRSSQMQPDVMTTVTVTKKGYESKPQKVSLNEGKERELVFVLKRVK